MEKLIGVAVRELVVGDATLRTDEEFEAMIESALEAGKAAEEVLAETVLAGRHAGLSWSRIGRLIGVSKQAAQQRFSSNQPDHHGRWQLIERRATALNEVSILKEEEAARRELVGVGPLQLLFRPSARQWEHRRVIRPSARLSSRDEAEGWQFAAFWFPFLYLKKTYTDEKKD